MNNKAVTGLTTTITLITLTVLIKVTPYGPNGKDFLKLKRPDTSSINTLTQNNWPSENDKSSRTARTQHNLLIELTNHIDTGINNNTLKATNIFGELGDNWPPNIHVQNSVSDKLITIPFANDDINFMSTNNTFDNFVYSYKYTWKNDSYRPSEGNVSKHITTSSSFDGTSTTSPVSGPVTMLLFGTVLTGLAGVIRKKKNIIPFLRKTLLAFTT